MVLSLIFCCKIHPLGYRIRVSRIVPERERDRDRDSKREREREFRHTDRKERREGGIGEMAMVECGILTRGSLVWRRNPKSSDFRKFSASSSSSSSCRTPALLALRAKPAAAPRVSMAMKSAHSPNDPFLAQLAAAASTPLGQAQLAHSSSVSNDGPPLLDIVTDPLMMAAPAQVSWRFGSFEMCVCVCVCLSLSLSRILSGLVAVREFTYTHVSLAATLQ